MHGTRTLRNISDTALWAAVYRARESERDDALFHDPLARRLAGERGEQIAATLSHHDRHSWAWVTRTWLFDRFIEEQVGSGAVMVVNLAAGLDARPYRMDLPASLRWVEVDLPELVAHKEKVLEGERPVCELRRIGLDLSSRDARRELFTALGAAAGRSLIVTEGLIIYLSVGEVASLAHDLAAGPSFQRWVTDVVSPGLLRLLQKEIGSQLSEARARLQFGPEEGPRFFEPHGWRPIDVRSTLKAAARLKRLPLGLRLLALLPERKDGQGSRPWSGICLLDRRAATKS